MRRAFVCLVLAATSAGAAEPQFRTGALVEVDPQEVRLVGKDSRQQLLVTGRLAKGAMHDLTREVTYRSLDPAVAVIGDDGVVVPAGNGTTTIEVRAGELQVSVPVTVEQGDQFLPVDFARDVVPILTKAGCNGGGCHGKADGRGSFQLSLFGFDPAADLDAVVNGSRGRRLFLENPENSLLLRKPRGGLSHGGGRRLTRGDQDYERLRRWIAAGAPALPGAAQLARIEVTPGLCISGHNLRQQVLVTAIYDDASRRDVTRLTEFRSNDPLVAVVNEHGVVTTQERFGETAIVCIYQGCVGVARILVPVAGATAEWPKLPRGNFIDDHVFAKLRQIGLAPSALVDDAGFLRRASLQLTGRLPTALEVSRFLADHSPTKRRRLVEQLAGSSASADYFAQKWADVLRNKRGRQRDREAGTIAFHRWIRNALAENMPYDQFAEAILTVTGPAAVHPPAQWYAEVRTLDRFVDDTAQVFLGIRVGCARCHHHPFEQITQEDYFGLAAFFARVGRKGGEGEGDLKSNEVIFVKPTGTVRHPRTGVVVPPHGLGGEAIAAPVYEDPRRQLVEWMRRPDNPYFARAFVNRAWAHFFGRGLVDPLDDMRTTNPASNEPLLDALAQEFVKSRFDMRHLVRLICTSTTYQLSAEPNGVNLQDSRACARFYPQRLPAEALLDAVDVVTGARTHYADLPDDTTATQLPYEDPYNGFLKLFGKPSRESACECERVASPTLSQALFLMNDGFIQTKLKSKSGRAGRMAKDARSANVKIDELFLTALSRPPTAEERKKARDYLQSEPDAEEAWRNLIWVLLNTKEFLYIR
jgi:hypothetical protein